MTANSFELQLNEYDYLNGDHGAKTVNCLALEERIHRLADKTWEVGRLASVTEGVQTLVFSASFETTPVVLPKWKARKIKSPRTLPLTLLVRLRNITTTSFKYPVPETVTRIVVFTGDSVLDDA
ncbi:MAG: hypothetical protein M2R45_03964 [Verrucomicrobia subdivision 3 bacterium]|nr:hypothetical protein [Limisphaerales bacterium]